MKHSQPRTSEVTKEILEPTDPFDIMILMVQSQELANRIIYTRTEVQ